MWWCVVIKRSHTHSYRIWSIKKPSNFFFFWLASLPFSKSTKTTKKSIKSFETTLLPYSPPWGHELQFLLNCLVPFPDKCSSDAFSSVPRGEHHTSCLHLKSVYCYLLYDFHWRSSLLSSLLQKCCPSHFPPPSFFLNVANGKKKGSRHCKWPVNEKHSLNIQQGIKWPITALKMWLTCHLETQSWSVRFQLPLTGKLPVAWVSKQC